MRYLYAPHHGFSALRAIFTARNTFMQNPQDVQRQLHALRALCPQAAPRVAIVLGTGLGALAEAVENAVSIPYDALPDFPRSTVASHAGRFVLGQLEGVPVICQQGRCHLYEGYSPREVCTGVRLMHALGAQSLLITCAAGALNPQFDAGDLMLITDHINHTGRSPLTGPNCDDWGPRFPDMSAVYDMAYRQAALRCAAAQGLRLERGVYLCTPGPQLETPAETRMFRSMGADAVGMSTVPEIILGRFLGLRCAAISVITNMGAGLSDESISHEHTKAMAPLGATKLEKVLRRFLRDHRPDG